ncbi:fer (fps/fes related) tyrosine kinase (phosphoprotein NCP94) [Planoprotostelium fungivorum]|uniref:Fer (Fps/fes related) tyrosine kinase (Phosphoprotein NCP94) n=1 Tax=Planoprotostelium fungivorum TaxID=1890364 RepID=A0A2P6NIZ1_9EUKA|nr:fer (fps/fes related) tyrosine kinase (phosphoprotein NCP94) [Planoprotostelium fungivorum]
MSGCTIRCCIWSSSCVVAHTLVGQQFLPVNSQNISQVINLANQPVVILSFSGLTVFDDLYLNSSNHPAVQTWRLQTDPLTPLVNLSAHSVQGGAVDISGSFKSVNLIHLSVTNSSSLMQTERIHHGPQLLHEDASSSPDLSGVSCLRSVKKGEELTEVELVTMVFDVVKGMVYLQTKNVIHRDIAARNMLLDTTRRVKISDFGLSRESDSKQIPYKWTAPEVIRKGTSTMQSDVWSFGVCAWEIFSFGELPYNMMDNRQAVKHVENGKRMDKPARCPEEVWKIILSCWSYEPESRPTFVSIRKQILKLYGENLKDVMKSTGSHVAPPPQHTGYTIQTPSEYSFSPEIGGTYHQK